jgi:hypothetical protein
MIELLNCLTERLASLLAEFSYERRKKNQPRSFLNHSVDGQRLKLIKESEKYEKQPLTKH